MPSTNVLIVFWMSVPVSDDHDIASNVERLIAVDHRGARNRNCTWLGVGCPGTVRQL